MEVFTMVNGTMESNMVKDGILIKKERKDKGSGKTEKELDGITNNTVLLQLHIIC